MAAMHAGPDISHRMPTDFPGVYGELAVGTNTVVFDHLDAIKDAIAVLNQYAAGDLSPNARRLPGSRAILHESMDAVKAGMQAVNAADPVAGPGRRGRRLLARGDAQRFDHVYRVMVEHLNTMMEWPTTTSSQLSHVLTVDRQRRPDRPLQGRCPACSASMRDDANTTVAQLTQIVGRIQREAARTSAPPPAEIAAGNNDLSRRTEQQAALAGGDRGVDGGADRHRAPERRQRAPGQPAGRSAPPAWPRRAATWSAQVVDTMGDINASSTQHRRHHRRDRRHRLPDQHPGAERRGRSGARRRAGPRLRRGGRRGAQPGAAPRRRGARDQGPDRRRRWTRSSDGTRAGRPGRRDDGRDRRRRCSA